jgi:hypothetical protein
VEVLGPAPPTPTKKELIARLAKPLGRVMSAEMADESDIDRTWILRKIHKNYLYYRDLAYFAPALYQGLLDATGIDGSLMPESVASAGMYDYTQNIYKGYCRKLVAVLGTRIPNATAVPNDPADENDIQAARAANDAAQYVRMKCDMQVQILWLVFSLFNFGTSFWNMEWVINPEKYGWKDINQVGSEPVTLGADETGAGGFQADAPKPLPPQHIPKGGLEISIYDASEVSVPLDADGRQGVEDPGCIWL